MLYRSSEINANLTKGTAEIPEVTQLLRIWHKSSEDPVAFQNRAIDENLLGKASRTRVRDTVKRVLAVRYFPNGDPEPARWLAELAFGNPSGPVLNRLLYYHAALAEHLLYVIVTDFLFVHRRRGMQTITTSDVTRYLRSQAAEGSLPDYSDSVTKRIAQHALAALRDFGILEGKVKKRVAPVRVPPEVVGYVVHALRDEGLSANRIVGHTDWRLFLLGEQEAEEAIVTASQHGYFTYSAAGTIRRFDWKYDSLDRYVHAIA